jgi:hypothetical protein
MLAHEPPPLDELLLELDELLEELELDDDELDELLLDEELELLLELELEELDDELPVIVHGPPELPGDGPPFELPLPPWPSVCQFA